MSESVGPGQSSESPRILPNWPYSQEDKVVRVEKTEDKIQCTQYQHPPNRQPEYKRVGHRHLRHFSPTVVLVPQFLGEREKGVQGSPRPRHLESLY